MLCGKHLGHSMVLSEIAFHEKAGQSQVRSSCFLDKVFLIAEFATVAMLPFALSRSDPSLGAVWAFSVQPVLPSDERPTVPSPSVEPGPGD